MIKKEELESYFDEGLALFKKMTEDVKDPEELREFYSTLIINPLNSDIRGAIRMIKDKIHTLNEDLKKAAEIEERLGKAELDPILTMIGMKELIDGMRLDEMRESVTKVITHDQDRIESLESLEEKIGYFKEGII